MPSKEIIVSLMNTEYKKKTKALTFWSQSREMPLNSCLFPRIWIYHPIVKIGLCMCLCAFHNFSLVDTKNNSIRHSIEMALFSYFGFTLHWI